MADIANTLPPRRHALEGQWKPGRYGRPGEAGVRLRLVHPVSIVAITARKGRLEELAAKLGLPPQGQWAEAQGIKLCWTGPGQFHAMAQGLGEGELMGRLQAQAAGLASLVDQSHGRLVLELEGKHVRALLARGTGVDLHPRALAANASLMTQMAHVGAHLVATGPDRFLLSVFRGFGENFFGWLISQAEDFGYELLA